MSHSDSAFPIATASNIHERGLTRRELFAMAAMQGFIAEGSFMAATDSESQAAARARHAVVQADALIAALATT